MILSLLSLFANDEEEEKANDDDDDDDDSNYCDGYCIATIKFSKDHDDHDHDDDGESDG